MSARWTEAEQRLQHYRCEQSLPTLTTAEQQQLQTDLQTLIAEADFVTLGICADHPAEAEAALASYWTALQQPSLTSVELAAIDAPCFLKANGRTGRVLLDTYEGEYRGVLLTIHSDLADGPSGTYGHFPLDLFAAIANDELS